MSKAHGAVALLVIVWGPNILDRMALDAAAYLGRNACSLETNRDTKSGPV